MSHTMIFILVLIAIVTMGRLARAGIELEARKSGLGPIGRRPGERGEPSHQTEIVERENEMLRGRIGRLEERIGVLERIAVDAPARLSAEIEKLRD